MNYTNVINNHLIIQFFCNNMFIKMYTRQNIKKEYSDNKFYFFGVHSIILILKISLLRFSYSFELICVV